MNKKTARRSARPGTTYAFVDAANVIYRDSDIKPWKIDLKKLFSYLKERFEAERVFYYGGVDNRNAVQLKLYQRLTEWGYELRLNPVKRFINNLRSSLEFRSPPKSDTKNKRRTLRTTPPQVLPKL